VIVASFYRTPKSGSVPNPESGPGENRTMRIVRFYLLLVVLNLFLKTLD
jgi:hypothetical protein